jgi:SAM-dependent methyltransferase
MTNSDHAARGPAAETNPFGRDYWEDRYSAPGMAWSGNPNPVLVSEAGALAPGRALDIGSGEGGDSIWLAQNGWRVTAVDIAVAALSKARSQAESVDQDAASRIDWERHDITEWAPEPQGYNLVSSQFMHLPEPVRSSLFRALAAAVRPGGTLLVVGHDASEVGADEHRAHHPDLMFTAEDVVAAIEGEGLVVEVAESRARPEPSGGGHLNDVVVRASRLAK